MTTFNYAMARKFMATCAISALALGSAPAAAAVQGSQGSTSTGSVSINASVPNRVRISGLDDISLLNLDPSVDASNNQDVCVWSNTSTRGYSITASGSGTGNAFTLASGASTVPYSVEWAGSIGQANGTARKNRPPKGYISLIRISRHGNQIIQRSRERLTRTTTCAEVHSH